MSLMRNGTVTRSFRNSSDGRASSNKWEKSKVWFHSRLLFYIVNLYYSVFCSRFRFPSKIIRGVLRHVFTITLWLTALPIYAHFFKTRWLVVEMTFCLKGPMCEKKLEAFSKETCPWSFLWNILEPWLSDLKLMYKT